MVLSKKQTSTFFFISALRTSPNWRRNSNASATWHVSAVAKPARAVLRRPRWPRRRSLIGDIR